MNILLLEGIHSIAAEHLKSQGFHVKEGLSPYTSISQSKDKDLVGLGVRSSTSLTKETLQSLSPQLGVIGAFCIGVDRIDLLSAARLGIPVFNAPYGNTRSVAELVISFIISLSRRTYPLNRLMHQNQWKKSARNSHEVRGKTLGIVGYGHIGTQVGILAEAMGMRVLYKDIIDTLPIGNAKATNSLEELLSASDFVTLHVPDTPSTRNLITSQQIKQMKSGSFLINTSRGKVVLLKDVKEALASRHLAGVAIDVFPEEPAKKESEFECPLQGMEQAILTPHIAGSTTEAQQNIARQVSLCFSKYLLHGISEGALNFPTLNPPPLESSNQYQRLINIHQNIPGVLGKINNLVSQRKLNINSQYLATNAQIGYLIMDVEKNHSDHLCQEVHKLPTSLRTQILPCSSS